MIKSNWAKAIVIGIPMAIAAAYYGLMASDQYASESRVVIKQTTDSGMNYSSLQNLLAGVTSTNKEDSLHVREFIHSQSFIQALDSKVNLRAAFQSSNADFVSRLSQKATQEEFIEYARNKMQVHFDETANVLVVKTVAFDPAYAQQLNKTILAESEIFVNQMSNKIAKEQLAFIRTELKQAGEALADANKAVISFQNRYKLLDPQQAAQANSELAANLKIELAKEEINLRSLRNYMKDDAGEVVAAKAKISALHQQIDAEESKLVSATKGGLNEIMARYQDLKVKADLALQVYKSAMEIETKVQMDTVRKVKVFAVIDEPQKAEEASYPKRLYILATLFVGLWLAYGIGKLLFATIKDHKD